MRKIIFSHRRAIGDCLMFTCGVRDFKLLFPDIQVGVDTNFPVVWDNNPYINRDLKKEDPSVEFYKVGYPIINNCNNASTHFTQGFLLDMIAIADLHEPLGLSIGEFCATFANGRVGDPDIGNIEKFPDATEPFTTLHKKYSGFCKTYHRQWPDIYLTDEEKSYNMVKDVYGIEKYWVIAPGGKSDCTCKIWDWRRFQDVIDHFEGRIKFVTVGRSDHIVERLNGVLDLTDKFNEDIRGLFPLTYHAEGCVSGISFLLHLAAGMPPRKDRERKPCVGIYGGREPTTFTGYTNHQILHTNGAFSCCDNGGCWQSRVIPLAKKEDGNKRLCHHPVKDNGKTIPECMDIITAQDVIRAIERYYDGNLYTYMKAPEKAPVEPSTVTLPSASTDKEINLLASLSSKGGGEQSALKLAAILRDGGWKVNFYPWGKVHENYADEPIEPHNFWDMSEHMANVPLLFYANDQIGEFCRSGEEIVAHSTSVIIGINYVNGPLPKCTWLDKTRRLKAVVFQNTEKRDEFERDRIGFDYTRQIVLHGAIDLQKFLEVCPAQRDGKELVILKHCTPDYRKYVTEESVGNGDKIHLWQKHIHKETDVKFYGRLLRDTKHTRFEFMEAHKELVNAYPNEPRMVFHKWDSMDVGEFLSRGHVYLYRTSNAWRDQYPRTVGEALAAGVPVLSEPRDGTKDRMDHGEIGFSCIDYDGFLYALRLLQRKEKFRREMGLKAKEWARKNLDPKSWLDVLA